MGTLTNINIDVIQLYAVAVNWISFCFDDDDKIYV